MVVFPISPGHPDMAGNAIPTTFASKVVMEFYGVSVVAAITNTDFESDSKQTDRVYIRTIPHGTMQQYTKGEDLTYIPVVAGVVQMNLDKSQWYSIPVDIVDKAQSDIPWVKMMQTGFAKDMGLAIDEDVLSGIYADAHASNKGASAGAIEGSYNLGTAGAPLSLTETNVIDFLTKCGGCLDQNEVPDDGRWIALPSAVTQLIKSSELKNASVTGDPRSPLRTGYIGDIDRFQVLRTNRLSRVLDATSVMATNVVFGHKSAVTFATQLDHVDDVTLHNTFGRVYRSLTVYGYKTVRDQGLGTGYITVPNS